jgi:hypothetical protein
VLEGISKSFLLLFFKKEELPSVLYTTQDDKWVPDRAGRRGLGAVGTRPARRLPDLKPPTQCKQSVSAYGLKPTLWLRALCGGGVAC